ncbi:hypothetical protein BH23GEM10_BH23GEM10_03440 [soil metagenome]
MRKLGAYLRDNATPIAQQTLKDWDALVEREPWHGLPQGLDMDHLPQLIACLVDASLLTFFGIDERSALAENAVKHGQHRFDEGVTEDVLQREYEVLRWGLWRRAKQQAPPRSASEAIIRLDSAMTFALGATLRGYHRDAIEETTDWSTALARYIAEWSFPSA